MVWLCGGFKTVCDGGDDRDSDGRKSRVFHRASERPYAENENVTLAELTCQKEYDETANVLIF